MNTINDLGLAESYYNTMLAKDLDKMASYLHDNVHFIGPLAAMQGKEPIVAAAKNFGGILQDIKIRSRFATGNQIMFAYDMVLHAPIGKLRAAVLMEFTEGFIYKIELFYDSSPFQERKNEIFKDGNN
ncbi:MAG: nuclear transport factor 2 family protein [Alphaproteobacteria bacterium]|jgi:hypothetical protein|nr:nuclear transport factor 2 family protein [Candidatus Jidaibacter sp.]